MASTIVATLWLCGAACVYSLDQGEDEASKIRPQAIEILAGMEANMKQGWVVQQHDTNGEGCGKASFHELGMTIPEWRKQHPGEDGFCYFQNYAWWFAYGGAVLDDYGYFGWIRAAWARSPTPICQNAYAGAGAGPAGRIQFANHAMEYESMESAKFDDFAMEYESMDSCLDAGDDPYCYTLGWLKGQRLDDTNIHNGTSWREKGVSECDRIQETYNFIDEEATVGAHIFGTATYLQKSIYNFLGTGPPVEARMYALHAYTKCQLGGPAAEMAYCYYKGCVLENGKVGHGPQCGYEFS